MILEISNPFTLETELHKQYLNLSAWLDMSGNLRLTIETDEVVIEKAQTLSLLFSGEQAETISKVIVEAIQGEPQILRNAEHVG